MKILIIYASHGGATRRCAEMLAKRLNAHHTASLLPVSEPSPAPDDYDAVVLGSSIRMGKADKTIKTYIKQQLEVLSSMPTAVFFCCGYPKQFEEYVETQLPKKLICSLGVHCFGGELKPEKLKGFDKLVVRIARSSIRSQDFEESDADHHALPELLPENVVLLAEKIEKLG